MMQEYSVAIKVLKLVANSDMRVGAIRGKAKWFSLIILLITCMYVHDSHSLQQNMYIQDV